MPEVPNGLVEWTPKSPPAELKEAAVKRALKSLAWDDLKQHLSAVDLSQDTVSELLGQIRRSTDFLIRRPDDVREAARFVFVKELRNFLESHAGEISATELDGELATIQRIESGYREILRTQERTVAAKLLPETQAAAALSRAAFSYNELMEAFHSSVRQRKELTLQSLRLKRLDGSSYSPDGVLAGIVDITTMTLMLLGYRYQWFDAQKFLVLPDPAPEGYPLIRRVCSSSGPSGTGWQTRLA